MPNLTKRHAQLIAKKLKKASNAEQPEGFRVTEVSGRLHDLVQVYYGEQWIAQFGIRRGKSGLKHNFIAEQLYVNLKQALEFANCPLSAEDYVQILTDKGVIGEET